MALAHGTRLGPYQITSQIGAGGMGEVLGSQDGIDFLIMEHLEGVTLAERLMKGALPLDQARRFARRRGKVPSASHRNHGVTR